MENNINKKFCGKCGAEMTVMDTYCPVCGEKSEGQVPPVGISPIQQYNMNVQQKNPLADKIDIKKTILNNIIPVVCLVIGLILIIVGIGMDVPTSYISSYSMQEYVGGDAYNFIIEACLRGGRIAGAEISKCLYIVIGVLIACVSALKVNIVKPSNEEN